MLKRICEKQIEHTDGWVYLMSFEHRFTRFGETEPLNSFFTGSEVRLNLVELKYIRSHLYTCYAPY